MKSALAKLTIYLFFVALLLNFFCLLIYSKNTQALALLALCCPLSLLVAERPRFTWYHGLFLLFIGYLILHKTLVFPEEKIFTFSSSTVLAFLAGMAAFQLLKDRNMNFMYLMNPLLLFVVTGVVALTAFGYIPYERIFDGPRLRLLTHHPNILGMMPAICLLTGLSFLLRKDFSDSLSPLLTTAGNGRLVAFLYQAAKSKVFILCGMLLSLVVLFLALSKSALFSTAIVGGLFCAYVASTRWGLLRSTALCVILALCAVAAWQLAPIEQQRKELFYHEVLSNALTPWKMPTYISRIPFWESAILAVKEKPLCGVGVGGFTDFHRKRVLEDYDRLVSIYGKGMIDRDTLVVSRPHNTYLLWFAETGIIGGVLFCLLFFTPLFYCLKKRTLCGEMGLILAVFAIAFFFDTFVGGSGRSVAFGGTIIFMTLGYFSGILGQSQTAEPVRSVQN